jgi:hypothetical protein
MNYANIFYFLKIIKNLTNFNFVKNEKIKK